MRDEKIFFLINKILVTNKKYLKHWNKKFNKKTKKVIHKMDLLTFKPKNFQNFYIIS